MSVPQLIDTHVSRGSGFTTQTNDFATSAPTQSMSSPLSQAATMSSHPQPHQPHAGVFYEDFDASQRGSSILDGPVRRSTSRSSTTVAGDGMSRSNTLKKKSSVKRVGSLKRSGSKKSFNAGSIRGFGGVDGDHSDYHSFSFTPVPTTGTPTDVLANRFQAWRQLLKSLIAYFREVQNSYESRAKSLNKVHNSIANIQHPAIFMSNNGLAEATRILEAHHKRSVSEANKAKEIENDVIGALTGLRSDLSQKIKEIKSLSGDFKNSVEKEKDLTRKEVEKLQDALQHADHEDGGAVGKNDPYVVRLGVEKQVEKQIDEENYLHRAYLNLESSGRELEAIVVGEIQKAYNALAGILKREADDAYDTVESLRGGPIAMPKDQEWYQFVTNDPHFVDPNLPLRRIEDIEYPGKHHTAATEIRAGMLERKSKYLKSYTPGWYVLSPTHLHEFKSADKIYSQPPVMSLYLLDQKLGSHSEPGSSSNKFMLKGKQAGSMHKGHNWVFRAESYDTMMAWFNDIRVLTEKTGEERQAFVRKHVRSVSGTSDGATVSSDGLEDDEADQAPYAADVASLAEQNPIEQKPKRPSPGGRFPSDLALRKVGTLTPNDGVEDSDDDADAHVIGAAGAVPGSSQYDYAGTTTTAPPERYGGQDPYRLDNVRTEAGTVHEAPYASQPYTEPIREPSDAGPGQLQPLPVRQQEYPTRTPDQSIGAAQPVQPQQVPAQQNVVPSIEPPQQQQQQQSFLGREPANVPPQASLARHTTEDYGEWMAPAAVGAAGLGAGGVGAAAHRHRQLQQNTPAATNSPQHDVIPPPAVAVEPTNVEDHHLLGDLQTTTANRVSPSSSVRTRSSASPALTVRASAIHGSSIDTRALGEDALAAAAIPAPHPAPNPKLPSSSASPNHPRAPPASPPLAGNEREGARATGHFFPSVVRHNTGLSISRLHVPGEFPPSPGDSTFTASPSSLNGS